MGKNLAGEEIGKGFRQRQDGSFEGRKNYKKKTIIYESDPDLEICKAKFFEKLKAWQSLLKKLKSGELSEAGIYTLDEWFDHWCDQHKRLKVRSSTLGQAYVQYNNTYKLHLGDEWLHEITREKIQEATNALRAIGKSEDWVSKGLSKLSESLQWAYENKVIENNPCHGIIVADDGKLESKPFEEISFSEKVVYLSFDDEAENEQYDSAMAYTDFLSDLKFLPEEKEADLLEAVAGKYYEPHIITLLYMGLRVGELGGLQWQDIDFAHNRMRVCRNLVKANVKGVKYFGYGKLKTKAAYRYLPIPPLVMRHLKKLRAYQEAYRSTWRVPKKFSDAIFTTKTGKPVTSIDMHKALERIVNAYNSNGGQLPAIHSHMLRHTFCCRLYREKKMDLKHIQYLMGHSSVSFMLDTYTHSSPQEVEEEFKKSEVNWA